MDKREKRHTAFSVIFNIGVCLGEAGTDFGDAVIFSADYIQFPAACQTLGASLTTSALAGGHKCGALALARGVV